MQSPLFAVANSVHLEIIKQGAEAWKQWLGDNHAIQPDLRHANLSGVDLNNADLSGADLNDANLQNANLSGAKLIGAELIGANLNDANLRSANLSGADLSGANLRGSNLCGANLIGADLSSADLNNANLCGANLRGADLIAANLSAANLSAANLSAADLSGAEASRCNFTNTVLTGACIDHWQVNQDTHLADVVCGFIYRKSEFLEYALAQNDRPFILEEIITRIQQALETVLGRKPRIQAICSVKPRAVR